MPSCLAACAAPAVLHSRAAEPSPIRFPPQPPTHYTRPAHLDHGLLALCEHPDDVVCRHAPRALVAVGGGPLDGAGGVHAQLPRRGRHPLATLQVRAHSHGGGHGGRPDAPDATDQTRCKSLVRPWKRKRAGRKLHPPLSRSRDIQSHRLAPPESLGGVCAAGRPTRERLPPPHTRLLLRAQSTQLLQCEGITWRRGVRGPLSSPHVPQTAQAAAAARAARCLWCQLHSICHCRGTYFCRASSDLARAPRRLSRPDRTWTACPPPIRSQWWPCGGRRCCSTSTGACA